MVTNLQSTVNKPRDVNVHKGQNEKYQDNSFCLKWRIRNNLQTPIAYILQLLFVYPV
jgi:hypothetical protein